MSVQPVTDPLEAWDLHTSHEPIKVPSTSGTTPAAFTQSGATQLDLFSCSFVYTASAAVATRTVRLEFLTNTGDVFASVATPYTIVANDAPRFTFGVGVQQFGANSAANIGAGIPPLRLLDGMQIRVRAVNADASDTVTGWFLYGRQSPVQPID